ncbi:hypothetical protein DPMN_169058 [Dreissena polymorpha]|uniref:Uncharacterized protein n=1 Tax=Dreissena polymorpha TaxID=45954 RepID=A0A9D4IXU3_DREPO|nr:hypothetical protein DPMN_169058 [Dreissena polymorpha]
MTMSCTVGSANGTTSPTPPVSLLPPSVLLSVHTPMSRTTSFTVGSAQTASSSHLTWSFTQQAVISATKLDIWAASSAFTFSWASRSLLISITIT